MYFLFDVERRWVQRHLAPEARRRGVAEDLRGWNWHQPPLSPIYDTRLNVEEIADQHCPTGRDLYLRRVLHVAPQPSPVLTQRSYLRSVLARVVGNAKRLLYQTDGNPLDALRALQRPDLPFPDQTSMYSEQLADWGARLWEFEERRVITRVQNALARQPGVGADALVALALPVVVDQQLDGSFLGLSSQLAAGAFVWAEQMVVDIRFDRKEPYHRLATTGYALALESVYEYPVTLGCIVYVAFRDGLVAIERDIHVIDDELRQWFIESRDERARLVEEEIDPGLPLQCPEDCPYAGICRSE